MTGVQMVAGGADPAPWGVTAKADGKVDQLGCGRGRTAPARQLGRGVQRCQSLLVTADGGQGEVACMQLGIIDDTGQQPLHPTPPRGAGPDVDAAGQQWVSETQSGSVDLDDP